MDNTPKKKETIILKRNKKEENNNYTKIYDLSLIDSIKDITPEEKFTLLCTIKKIILCTNNYMHSIFIEISVYLFVYFLTFILYYIVLLPIFKYFILTEEQNEFINKVKQYNFIEKIKIFFKCHSIELIVKMPEKISIKNKIKKLYLYYAKHELDKIKNDFIIDINETNYDLTIKRNKNKNNIINENKTENDFYQYVICYPDSMHYGEELSKMLNEDEKSILQWAFYGKHNSIVQLKKMFFARLILIPIFYIVSFYYLTLIRVKIFYIVQVIRMILLSFINFYFEYKIPTILKISDYVLNKKNIKKGYILNTETDIIEIFKLKEAYEGDDEVKLEDLYLKYFKQIEAIHYKFESPLIKYFLR